MMQIQSRAFFNKLGEYGIVPANDAEAADLLGLADLVLSRLPPRSEQGAQTKQACMDALGLPADLSDGCSAEAHQAAEHLCKQAHIVEAAKLSLASRYI